MQTMTRRACQTKNACMSVCSLITHEQEERLSPNFQGSVNVQLKKINACIYAIKKFNTLAALFKMLLFM